MDRFARSFGFLGIAGILLVFPGPVFSEEHAHPTPLQAQTPTAQTPPSQTVSPEELNRRRTELNGLIEERRKMVSGGAGFTEVKAVTEQIGERYRALVDLNRQASGRPPMGMMPSGPGGFAEADPRFVTLRSELNALMMKRKELTDTQAPAEQIQDVTRQIEEKKQALISIVQAMAARSAQRAAAQNMTPAGVPPAPASQENKSSSSQ